MVTVKTVLWSGSGTGSDTGEVVQVGEDLDDLPVVVGGGGGQGPGIV